MRKKLQILMLVSLVNFLGLSTVFGQCADPANIYTFVYDGRTYEVVKEGRKWVDAAACAVERGGYLVEINDAEEQNTVYGRLGNAGIVLDSTIAPDGGEASYVWLGANDIAKEGNWVWDGHNDADGALFWIGKADGNAVGELYNNWGNEPDNYVGQDGLGIALTQWPINTGSLGSPGQWNDVDEKNPLYYVIEYDFILGVGEQRLNDEIKIQPNPMEQYCMIINDSQDKMEQLVVQNVIGQNVKTISAQGGTQERIMVGDLAPGIYFVNVVFEDGRLLTRKVVKR